MTDDPRHDIARLVDEAQPIGAEPVGGEGEEFDPSDSWGGGDPPEPPFGDGVDDPSPEKPDTEAVEWCARLDHSDTDNARRLIRHFGRDMAVMAQDEVSAGSFLSWTGTHWDLAGGLARAKVTVQMLGSRILMEANYLAATPRETRAIEAAAPLRAKKRTELNEDEKVLLNAGDAAEDALGKRQAKRRAWAITSKNKGRMDAALDCAAPRLRRSPDAFNEDRHRIATRTHTLQFAREEDLECPDPNAKRFRGVYEAIAGHRREDWITAVVPQAYDPTAKAERWRAFLDRMLPDEAKRRTVQQFTALGLLSLHVQYLMFPLWAWSEWQERLHGDDHAGAWAEPCGRTATGIHRRWVPNVLRAAPLLTLPGSMESGSSVSSRVAGNQQIQEDMIKKLTGGEAIPVRSLYKGYFEFSNFATAHMSGNDFPRIDGTDNGIWRRLLVVQLGPDHTGSGARRLRDGGGRLRQRGRTGHPQLAHRRRV